MRTLALCLMALGWLSPAALAQEVGNCNLGTASADLNVNNVNARLYNNGGLFWKGGDPLYNVPSTPEGTPNAIFASGIWLGGEVDGQLRMAAATYSNWEFWPGPLDENGNPPANCAEYDRIYNVYADDVAAYLSGQGASQDLTEWPVGLGAPAFVDLDGDGERDADEPDVEVTSQSQTLDLAAGELPEVLGDQTAFWVMNDRGNAHETTATPPIGLEVRVTAFAFRRADALNNTTFYRYELIYKGEAPLENAYFGIWSDPDLGNAGDDFVGSDPELGLGFVYNGGETDSDYGIPPALGYDFFQGPLVNNDGIDNDEDGVVDEEDERLQMEKFVYYNNDSTPQGNPNTANDYYGYLRGIWKNGQPITLGGTGIGGTEIVDYMFPGDPVTQNFWSEENTDGSGARNAPADRRFIMSSGPFTIRPGDVQEIVYGIVWAQGQNRLNSVTALRAGDRLAQNAFNVDFQLPSPPSPPRVAGTCPSGIQPGNVGTFDQTIVLNWGYCPNDNNFLGGYDVQDPFLEGQDVDDDTYTFEGFRLIQYESPADQEGELIGIFDVVNGVTVVTERVFDGATGASIEQVTARGNDSGVQYSATINNVVNYRDYFFGIQAYAYNANSVPAVFNGPVNRFQVRPSRTLARGEGTVAVEEALGSEFVFEKDGAGDGQVAVEVTDPTLLTGDTYRVEFVEVMIDDGEGHTVPATSYNLVNVTTGNVIVDASELAEANRVAPQGTDVVTVDGLSFDITGPVPSLLTFVGVDGAEHPGIVEIVGPGGEPACPPGDTSLGCPTIDGDLVDFSLNSTGVYFRTSQGTGSEATLAGFAPNEFEIRFTEEGSYVYHAFTTGTVVRMPFEVWDIGVVAPGTENDPSDDVQLIPAVYSDGGDECTFNFGESTVSGYPVTDRIYAYYPTTTYDEWEAYAEAAVGDGCEVPANFDNGLIDYGRGRPLQREVIGQFADITTADLQDAIIRYYTVNPNLPGDVFTLESGELDIAVREDSTEALEEALDLITIVPNPYKGRSSYEVQGELNNVARFTNLPYRATIRIFTLDGTLIRTLQKEGPSNSLDYNLENENGLPIASGIYLIHIEARDSANQEIGERVLKFAVIKRRPQLERF